MKDFPERLRKARKQKKLTQPGLADLVGVSKGAVGNWESGANLPDDDSLRKLSEVLGISEAILRGESEMKEPSPAYQPSEIDPTVFNDERLSDMQNYLNSESRRSDIEPAERNRIFRTLRAVVAEQERRINSAALSAEQETGLAHAGEAQRLSQEFLPKRKAGGTNADKPAPGGDAGHPDRSAASSGGGAALGRGAPWHSPCTGGDGEAGR